LKRIQNALAQLADPRILFFTSDMSVDEVDSNTSFYPPPPFFLYPLLPPRAYLIGNAEMTLVAIPVRNTGAGIDE
jgi:hypothetical protein